MKKSKKYWSRKDALRYLRAIGALFIILGFILLIENLVLITKGEFSWLDLGIIIVSFFFGWIIFHSVKILKENR